jgi:hypothetical protein
LSDKELSVGSCDGDPNIPFVAEPQKNNINRALVRFGISYDELKQRPNYWTIEKQMADYYATKARVIELEAEVKRLSDVAAAR